MAIINPTIFQTFQRIQRNRQSRIRVKLSRRAGERPDEILEEEIENSSLGSPNTVGNLSGGIGLHHLQRLQVSNMGSVMNPHRPQSTSTPGRLHFINTNWWILSCKNGYCYFNVLCYLGPGSQTAGQIDDEDIDIVGDNVGGGTHGKSKNHHHHNTSSVSSQSGGEGSADGSATHIPSSHAGELQVAIYGPPQFTEADVLACMGEVEIQAEGDEIKNTYKQASIYFIALHRWTYC